MRQIYLDYNSTTPVDPRVFDAMKPFFNECFGNTSSPHAKGREAKKHLERARAAVANIISAQPESIHFVRGATEANNIVLKSVLGNQKNPKIITTNTEHSSIDKTIEDLNLSVCKLKINKNGNIDYRELKTMLSQSTVHLVSVIAVNNEIGTIHNLRKIGKICKKYGVRFHTDATQALGKIDIDVNEMNIDALSCSAHKIYGPKGTGVLYVRDNYYHCSMFGGRQEVLTSGTVNVAGAVGMAKACELMDSDKDEAKRIEALRDRLAKGLLKIGGIKINGTMKNRLYNNLNITIDGVPAEVLVMGMDDICISTGSACSSGEPEPSHVIKALGVKNPESAIRLSLGRWNTEDEIDYTINRIREVIKAVRND